MAQLAAREPEVRRTVELDVLHAGRERALARQLMQQPPQQQGRQPQRQPQPRQTATVSADDRQTDASLPEWKERLRGCIHSDLRALVCPRRMLCDHQVKRAPHPWPQILYSRNPLLSYGLLLIDGRLMHRAVDELFLATEYVEEHAETLFGEMNAYFGRR